MNKNSILWSIFFVAIFTGSIFITSGKFVDAENSSKFYFVALMVFISIVANAIYVKCFVLFKNLVSLNVLKGIFVVCFIQAIYGILQYSRWLPSNHSKFIVTGSFDNPAGFAAILSLAFPIGLFLLLKLNHIERYFVATGLVVIIISVFLSESRAGMLAVITSSLILVFSQIPVIRQIKQNRFYRLLFPLSIFLLFAASLFLYNHKKDSANGRILIWKISCEMIIDKPILGHGYGAFKAKYMDYQAKYFIENQNSKYSYLADNVKHPFNEFMLVTVEFGIIGLILVFAFILFIFCKIKKSTNEFHLLILMGLVAFLTFASFSYPLQYVAIWLLFAYYFSLLLPPKEIRIINSPLTILARTTVVVICCLCLLFTLRQAVAEIKWNATAQNSLNGKTIAMIPEYEKLYPVLRTNPFFLYNYGAELNIAEKYDESTSILLECQKRFNDYDLQLLLADNYQKKGEFKKAIQIFEYASNMIPCRFWPLDQIFEIYKETGQNVKAIEVAKKIMGKEIKIPSLNISSIKAKAEGYLKNSVNE